MMGVNGKNPLAQNSTEGSTTLNRSELITVRKNNKINITVPDTITAMQILKYPSLNPGIGNPLFVLNVFNGYVSLDAIGCNFQGLES